MIYRSNYRASCSSKKGHFIFLEIEKKSYQNQMYLLHDTSGCTLTSVFTKIITNRKLKIEGESAPHLKSGDLDKHLLFK